MADLPFDRVVEAVSPVRSLSRNPLFSVVVHVREDLPTGQVIDTGPDGDTTFTALEPTFDVAHADLSLNFFAGEQGYRGHVIYRPELYQRATMQRLVDWLGRIVRAFAEQPDDVLRDIEIMDPDDSARLLDWGGGAVYVLDDALKLVPVGVVGDVYVTGAALERAGWDRAGLTATRFVPNPFAAKPGSRLYRGGEQGRWTQDGRLEFVGRTTADGARQPSSGGAAFEPPSTETERALAAMLGEVLGVAEVGRYDDYFDLGGDSILAVQLAARARDAGLPLTARMVFEHTVVADLAKKLDDTDAVIEDDDTSHEPMTVSGLSADELAAFTSSWRASGGSAP